MKINLRAIRRAFIISMPFWFLTVFIISRIVLEGRTDFIPYAGGCATLGAFFAYADYVLWQMW